MATWRPRSSPPSLASPDPGGRTPSAGMPRHSPCSPPWVQATAGGASTSTGGRTAKPSGCSGSAKSRRRRETMPPPGTVTARAAVAAPRNDTVAQAQERLAMDWLDNIRVTEGKQTFTEIANTLQPVLARGAASSDNRRAANALAHLGWADFLRSREGAMGLDPPHYYRQAIERDPQNVYAHAMWGHDLLQRGGSVDEAKAHFAAAVATDEQRPYVRRIQIAALLWRDDPNLENELVRVANEMRTQGEARPADDSHDSVWRLWNVY